jgi:RNA recognition motif-containing protein
VKFFSIKNNKTITKNQSSFTISLEKIKKGEDKRTSIIIKNLPNSINKEFINEMLLGVGNINYLYLPFDKYSNKNLGFAFVNMVNYRSIIQLYNKLKEYKFDKFEMKRPVEICYSKVQGKNELSQMFKKN